MLNRIGSKFAGATLVVAVLAVAAMCCANESASADESRAGGGAVGPVEQDPTRNAENAIREGERDEPVHVLGVTLNDVRRLLEGRRAPPMGTGCEHWPDAGSLGGILIPVPRAPRLFVGERRDAEQGMNGFSIRTQRNYAVTSFRRSGSPLVGEIVITLPKAVAQAERVCVRRLAGMSVNWLNWPDEVSKPVAAEMVVRDVQWARAALVGSDGDSVETGDTVAKLSVKEGWLSMAYRKLKAQFWGVVAGTIGTVVLSIATAILVRMRRRLCWNRTGRASAQPSHDAEGGSDQDLS